MQRSITVGLVGTTLVGGAALLAVALSTVLNFGGGEQAAMNTAREAMKGAIDAPRPEDVAAARPAVAKPAQPKLAAPSWIWAPGDAVSKTATLARRFTLDAPVRAARLVASIDNSGRVLLDGREIAAGDDWGSPF